DQGRIAQERGADAGVLEQAGVAEQLDMAEVRPRHGRIIGRCECMRAVRKSLVPGAATGQIPNESLTRPPAARHDPPAGACDNPPRQRASAPAPPAPTVYPWSKK